MVMRAASLAFVLLSATLLSTAQEPARPPQPAASNGQRQRLHDVPTPSVLQGLRTTPYAPIEVNAGGRTVNVPEYWAIDPATGAAFRRGELLVRFRDDVDAITRAQALRANGASRIVRTLPGHWSLVQLERDTPARLAADGFAARPDVVEVSLNYRLDTQQLRPNDEFFQLQWNFEAINLPAAWQINPGARNDVIVAVVDSGLNVVTDTFVFPSPFAGEIPVRFAEVPDLVTSDRIVAPYDFIWEDEFPMDLGGHGTHVAGTVAQQTNNNMGVAGVAYNVKLMPLKVLSGGGGLISWDLILGAPGPGGTATIVSEAIRYAADNGARVINLSLGGPGPIPTVRDAIAYAVGRGAFVAIAAGNNGDDGNPVEYPASYASGIDGAMAVGAVNRQLRRASYSGHQPYVEICAPGGEVESPFDYEGGITQVGYNEAATLSFLTAAQKVEALLIGFRPRFDRFELRPFNGTSMAAPHVSGVAALLYSQGIHSPGAIEAAIKRFAKPIEATSEECGAGLVDARRALRGLGLAR